MSAPDVRGYHAPPVDDVRALLRRLPPRIQLLRADRIYGKDHLLHAARLAQRALAQGRARAQDVATETVVYAAGERQIGRALAFVGLQPGVESIAAVAWDEPAMEAFAALEGWRRDDTVLAGGAHVLDAFGVTHEQRALFPRERWGDIILERVALSDVLKA